MSSLSGLPGERARVAKAVMREVAQLATVPWHLHAYCESCGAPPIPDALLARIRALDQFRTRPRSCAMRSRSSTA